MKKVPVIDVNTGKVLKTWTSLQFVNPKKINSQTKTTLFERMGMNMLSGRVGFYTASYEVMQRLFGEPEKMEQTYTYSKESTQWSFSFTDKKTVYPLIISLYDYKETSLFNNTSYPTPAEFRS